MKRFATLGLSATMAAMLFAGCSNMSSDNRNNQLQSAQVTTGDKAPVPQQGFRFSADENADIANKDKLSYRIFYNKPSIGADAKWFDAVKRGDLPTVQYMVAHGQNLEAKDTGNLGQTALGWVAFIGYEDMVDYLVAQGADIHATDKGDVYNVMKSAALGKNTKVVKKIHDLLKAEGSVDLNDQTVESDGETLIMVAASNNRIETVKYLLAQGANPNLVATTKNKKMGAYNQSAYSYACTRGHVEMQKVLAENGAINHRTGQASCE